MTDETTTEQLVEIEGQAEDTPATEYTLPEGWQEVPSGEPLKGGDEYHAGLNRYIRRTESQPEPVPVQVCEGRWRTRRGDIKNIRPCEPLRGAYFVWPWTDGFMTFQDNGRHQGSQESPHDLVEYLGPIEPQAEPVPAVQGGLVRDVTHLLQESGVVDLAKAEQQIEELRSEVSYVQNLLGTERQRVTQLEELVGSLRTINEAQEKTVKLAGQENTDVQHRLSVVADQWWEQTCTINGLQQQLESVKAELVAQAETSRKLRIELDAAQQVPQAVSDRFEEGWDAGTARAVETIAEWTEPFRKCGSERLAWMVMQNLPHIMRSLTGLADED